LFKVFKRKKEKRREMKSVGFYWRKYKDGKVLFVASDGSFG